jgi:hypothetical protein
MRPTIKLIENIVGDPQEGYLDERIAIRRYVRRWPEISRPAPRERMLNEFTRHFIASIDQKHRQ